MSASPQTRTCTGGIFERRPGETGRRVFTLLRHMKRKPVTSSVLASVGYNPDNMTLEIEFRSTGFVYRYFDVPEIEFRRLLSAKSLGRYFNHNIKDDYRYIQIR